MGKKILTLCVAAYNVEKSIGAMIQSVIDSGDAEKIELMIINDGSTDDTGKIVNGYLKKHPNMITYIEKENGGSGSARNVGIRNANGVYFKILDGDDKVDPTGLHKLLQQLEDESTDLVLTKRLTMQGERVLETTQWKNMPVGKKINLEDIPVDFDLQMHYVTIKTTILQKHDIKLTEKISYVDTEFVAYCLPYVRSVMVEDYVVYIYYTGMAMQSMNAQTCFRKKKQMEKITTNIAKYYVPFWQHEGISDKKRKLLESVFLKRYMYTLELYLKDKNSSRADYIAFDKQLSSISDDIDSLLSGQAYVRMVRLGNYKMYYLVHAYRVVKYQIYCWIKGV